MAKLSSPLLSLEASGTVVEVLTFSKRKIVNQVRYQRAQKDYVNPARSAQRTHFQMAVGWWGELEPAEKDQWLTIGRKDC